MPVSIRKKNFVGKKISKSVKKQIFNVLFLVALVALTIFLLVKSNEELSFENILKFIRAANPWLLVVAVVCMLLFIFFEGLSLHIINARLGQKRKLISSVVYSTADIYYSALTPSASGGQPASAYYMIKDGIDPGETTFALVFNLIAYTAAILVIAVAAAVCDIIFGGIFFLNFNTLSKVLIILGVVLQSLLLAFFVLCMCRHKAVLKVGNWFILLLSRIKIIKKTEKWQKKLADEVEKYKHSYEKIKQMRGLFAQALLFNVLQRVSQIFVTCFVCMAVAPEVPFLYLFAMQAYVLVGYNSIPLPGGVGAFEVLFLDIFALQFAADFVASAMMVSRVISYYLCMIVSGIFTLSYHVSILRRKYPAALPIRSIDGTEGESVSAAEEVVPETEGAFEEEQPAEEEVAPAVEGEVTKEEKEHEEHE